ncbi:MAG: hypothetical protein IPG71_09345 [bacterium]|nr:hypothetical protein [bacterium]
MRTFYRKTDEVLAAIEAHLAAIGEEQEPSEKGTVRDRSNIFSDDPLRETLDAYKEAIDKDPTHPQAWVDRGKFHEMLLNDAEALADARCATTISPDHPGANLLLSHALENHEHFSDALKALWRYIENAHEEHIDDVIEAALYIRILQSALSLDEHSE